MGHPLDSDPAWNATNSVYTYPNGAKLEFFSADKPDKVLGPARKRLFLNEANHLSYDTYRQLAVRTSGIIFIDYNPSSICWIQKKIEPKTNCVLIKSTYKDNPFLTDQQIKEIEDNKDDKNWWKVFGLGEDGTLDGLVYEFDQVDVMPEHKEMDNLTELYGMDFGFTNDPTAVVHILADKRKKEMWVEEVCYQTHMLNSDIVEKLRDKGVQPKAEIYADCAEPKSIADIKKGGFNVLACDKDAPVKSDKLKFQLLWMQGWKIHVTKESLNLIEELRNYTWKKNKDGETTNEPIDNFNHLLDAMRYALWTRFGKNGGQGQYVVSVIKRKRS